MRQASSVESAFMKSVFGQNMDASYKLLKVHLKQD